MYACTGILFNHESPRRGSNFVTNKVVKTAVEIKYGLKDKLIIGNMDSYDEIYDYIVDNGYRKQIEDFFFDTLRNYCKK
jgi:GDPmannose 4,6-dehydratase